MSILKNLTKLCFLISLLMSCEEVVEPVGECEVYRWASATRNGEDLCLGTTVINYWNPNTENAYIGFTAGSTERVGIPEIDASFGVPVAGITLNTDYPLLSGKIAAADELTEGFISFITFDYPSCVAGTFELIATDTIAGVTQTYKNGKFVFNFEGTLNSMCNPFN